MRVTPAIPPEVEDHRDTRWWREATQQISTALDAERFVEQTGFAACLTDARRSGPSLYVAVCGRRDAVMPRNVQQDPEASLAWELKDELLRRGKVYYGKLGGGRTTFIAPRMMPYFHAIWGLRRADEARRLSKPARAILNVLRHEWEMGTADLRKDSGVSDRAAFTRGLDELQSAMIVIPGDVVYQPFYLHLDAGGRPVSRCAAPRVPRDTALREIARCFLTGAQLTIPATGAGDGSVAARGRTRQSRARRRRLCDDVVTGYVSTARIAGRGRRRRGVYSSRSATTGSTRVARSAGM